MTFRLEHHGYSLPEGQAWKLVVFAPCKDQFYAWNCSYPVWHTFKMTLTLQLQANHRFKLQQFVKKRGFVSQQTVIQMLIFRFKVRKRKTLNEVHLYVPGNSVHCVLSHAKISFSLQIWFCLVKFLEISKHVFDFA